jgi:hypothetical protein
MIRAFTNIGSLDWGTWFIGLMGAAISGAAAVLSTLTGSAVAGLTSHQFWIMTGVNVGVAVLVSLGKYLQNTPTPTPIQQKVDVAEAAAQQTVKAVADVKDAVNKP